MSNVPVILFWVWLLGSLGYLVFRKFSSGTETPAATDPMALFDAAPTNTASPTASPATAASPMTAAPTGPITTRPLTPAPRTTAAPGSTPEPAAAELLPAVARAMAAERGEVYVDPNAPDSPTGAAANDPSPDGTFSAADPVGPVDDLAGLAPAVAAIIREQQVADGLAPATAPAATLVIGTCAPLAETLYGIGMPADLAPLSNVVPLDAPDDRRERMVMVTSAHDTATVTALLSQELQRLTLDVTMLADHRALARRGDRAVEIRIHGDPHLVANDSGPLFPTTQEGDTVVEFLAA